MRRIVGTIFLVGGVACTLQLIAKRPARIKLQKQATAVHADQLQVAGRQGEVSGKADLANKTFTLHLLEVQELAPLLAHSTGISQSLDARVESLGRQITASDAPQLRELALNTEGDHSARYLAVYLLSEHPEVFAAQLEEIASATNPSLTGAVAPHTAGEQQRHFEEALHAQALSALDKLNLQDNREFNFFTTLRTTHPNALIRKLAWMGAVGAENRKTLINQYINAEL